MRVHRALLAGVCLLIGMGALAAQDQPRRTADERNGVRRPGEFNARPAKGERYPDTLTLGDPAPGFTLPDLSGEKQVTLSDSKGKRPVVLVFGSCTCPPFRRQIGEVERIYQTFKEQADFLLVYIREAHPGSQIPGINEGQAIDQTETLAERMTLAADFVRDLNLTIPVLVDREDNKVNAGYAAWPNRLVIVGADGNLAYIEKPGAGFLWGEVEEWLKNIDAAPAARAADKPPVAAAREITGTFARFNADEKSLVMTVNGKDQTFPLGAEAKLFVGRRNRQIRDVAGGLGRVPEGSGVRLTIDPKEGQDVVIRIAVAGRPRTEALP